MAGHELDQFDMRLLRVLSENCRKTNKERVETVKLSHAAISRRITRLEERGVPEG